MRLSSSDGGGKVLMYLQSTYVLYLAEYHGLAYRSGYVRVLARARILPISSHPRQSLVFGYANHAAAAACACSKRSISRTMHGVRNSFRTFRWCAAGWCLVQ